MGWGLAAASEGDRSLGHILRTAELEVGVRRRQVRERVPANVLESDCK